MYSQASIFETFIFSTNLHHPPGQDTEAGHGPGGQQLPIAAPEQRAGQAPELRLGPGLVHQLNVLIPPDTKQPGDNINQSASCINSC